ncbi:MAG: 16S rRNA (guanine(966)-N(2))-methyltransferase RsmD [Arsenophonus sp.]
MTRKIQLISHRKIRIISGKWRGYKIPILNSEGLRPTKDRIRETLFNWLIPIIQDAHCLDCFAGSGVLSIEALSRYAASATLIELKSPVAKQIMVNLSKLGAKNSQVINTNALDYLVQRRTVSYDIIFLDPPFYKDLLEQIALLLEQNGWLTKNCWIYVETESEDNLRIFPKNWQLHRKKISGRITYCIYIRH